MKKSLLLCFVTILMESSLLSAQDTVSNGKALNFPFKKYGISIGNSYEFTGIRINWADKNVKKVNGLNVTFWINWSKMADVNGMSIGLIPMGRSLQFINLGLLGVATWNGNLNGVSIGGLFSGVGGNINGLSINGLLTIAGEGCTGPSTISGIALSGFGLGAGRAVNGLAIGGFNVGGGPLGLEIGKAINGLAIAGYAVGTKGNINGIASSLVRISAGKNFRGISVTTGYLSAEVFKGTAISGYTKTYQMYGLSIALYNRTIKLHGVQLGLINRAENNPKGLKILPFFNFHL